MPTTEDDAVAVGHRVDPACWQAGLEELLGRVEPRQRAGAFVRGRRTCRASTAGGSPSTPASLADGMGAPAACVVWDED